MPSRRARLIRTLLGLAVAAALIPSCGGGGGGGGGFNDGFDRQALLTHIATTYAIPSYQAFKTQADLLATACLAYETAELADAGDKLTKKDDAQAAWKAALLAWSACELFQFGPAGASTVYKGGADLRDQIYAWPFVSPCQIDTEIVQNEFGMTNFFYTLTTVNAGGLAAIEYLLFYTGTSDSCAPNPSPIGWGALTTADKEDRRATYARAAAEDVAERAQALIDAWTAPGGFLEKFNNAAGSGVYSSAHEAVNEVFGSIFYYDQFPKDRKLGQPLGLNVGGVIHPELRESPFAETSIPQLIRNVETFEKVFLGNDPGAGVQGIGFDDFLIARGAPALAATMAADIAASRVAVQGILGADIGQAVQDIPGGSKATALAAHAALKKVTDNLKSQFVTVLNLTVPATGATDTD